MFDTVLGRGNAPKPQLGKGAAISLALHVALIVGAIVISSYHSTDDGDSDVEVTFFAAPPPPPPPPPPKRKAAPKVENKIIKKPNVIQQPKTIPIEKPPEVEPPPEEPAAEDEGDEGVEGGVEGGVVGGVVGGVLGGAMNGTLGGQLGSEVIPFGEGMTKPERLEGADPSYSREALEARVEGLMVVKCVISTSGRLDNCRIIKPLPHMEQPVLSAMSTWRYRPVSFQGRAVNVDYVFYVRLVLPR